VGKRDKRGKHTPVSTRAGDGEGWNEGAEGAGAKGWKGSLMGGVFEAKKIYSMGA